MKQDAVVIRGGSTYYESQWYIILTRWSDSKVRLEYHDSLQKDNPQRRTFAVDIEEIYEALEKLGYNIKLTVDRADGE